MIGKRVEREIKFKRGQISLKFLLSLAAMVALSIAIISVLKPLATVEDEGSALSAKLEAIKTCFELHEMAAMAGNARMKMKFEDLQVSGNAISFGGIGKTDCNEIISMNGNELKIAKSDRQPS